MPKISVRNGNGSRTAGTTKYDAHHTVLSQTYGALADLRRELSDSKETVTEREDMLRSFAACADSQRAWLLLEDYFEKLSLSRKDFPDTDWWPRLLAAQGRTRLEELAFLFLRAKRSLPPELQAHASLDRFAQVEEAEQEQQLVRQLEDWLSPPAMPLLDTPRAFLRVVCRPQPDEEQPARHRLAVQFHLSRPRTGEKVRTLREMIDLDAAPRTNRNCFRPPIGNSSSGWPRRNATPLARRGDAGVVGRGIAALAGALGPHAALRMRRQTAAVSRPGRRADAAPGERRQGTGVHAS